MAERAKPGNPQVGKRAAANWKPGQKPRAPKPTLKQELHHAANPLTQKKGIKAGSGGVSERMVVKLDNEGLLSVNPYASTEFPSTGRAKRRKG